jgi:hypothetical protein
MRKLPGNLFSDNSLEQAHPMNRRLPALHFLSNVSYTSRSVAGSTFPNRTITVAQSGGMTVSRERLRNTG